jgi:hypothetical protein
MTTVYMNRVSPRYFATMGTPLLAGREFTDADDKNSRRVAIVNESFARRFFHGGAAVGRKFTAGNGKVEDLKDLEIVGVAANTKYSDPREKQTVWGRWNYPGSTRARRRRRRRIR